MVRDNCRNINEPSHFGFPWSSVFTATSSANEIVGFCPIVMLFLRTGKR
jgi:hypothetical protein